MARARAAWWSTESSMTSPTSWTPVVTPSRRSSSTAVTVGHRSSVAKWSVTTRLISSGMRRLKLRSPASTWATGIESFQAARAPASVELVSP